jgi:ABC-type polysaccharide/polyol phosphate export permease
MVTPLAMVLVFSIIFTKVFTVPGTPDFPLFFLVGYLPWQFLAGSLMDSVVVIAGNGSLLRQVKFPREYLPLSKVAGQGVHFALSLLALFAFALFLSYNFAPFLGLLVLTVVLHLAFVAGISMAVAAVNVVFRDLQELLQVLLIIWFYATPIIYRIEQLPASYQRLILLNPMTWYLDLYRHVFYYLVYPPAKVILVCAALSAASLVIGYVLFMRLAQSFCKEL